MNYRKIIFYLKDSLKGGIISKHIKDIDAIIKDPLTENSKSKIENRKKELLKHALKNVPFYRNNSASSNENLLVSFPVVNKNIIRDNIYAFISDNYDINTLSSVVTSGSTGTPFSVYHDSNKKARNSADTIYFGALAGFSIGTQLNYLKIWTKVNRKNKLKSWLENIIPVDVTELSDNEIKKLVLKIKSQKNEKAFLGYSSALQSICDYLKKNEPNTRINNVSAIISMSEGISLNTKNNIKYFFQKQPVSRYSNVENGILAQQSVDGSEEFIVNWASYHIEILDLNNDSSVPYGVPGRIVITDLFNYAMPIIRYDTGDIGILNNNNSGIPILTNVEGRKMDMVFTTKGTLVSSFTITNNMWLYPEIKQYQFIQTNKSKYLFKINIEGKFDREQLLISEFKKYFGVDAEISVEYVNEIPLLNSGKRKKVMNLMSK